MSSSVNPGPLSSSGNGVSDELSVSFEDSDEDEEDYDEEDEEEEDVPSAAAAIPQVNHHSWQLQKRSSIKTRTDIYVRHPL